MNSNRYLCKDEKLKTIDTIELKSDLHSLIDKVNDATILNTIKAILSKQAREGDFWDELPLNVQESVKRGMVQAKKGQTKAHSEVMKKYEKRL